MILEAEEKIKLTDDLLKNLVGKLNYNYKIIKSVNSNLSERAIIYLTLYKRGNYWSDENTRIRNHITDEMYDLVSKKNPLVFPELIDSYFNQLLYDLKGRLENNLVDLDRYFLNDYNTEFKCYSDYIDKYIAFNSELEEFALKANYKERIKEYYNKLKTNRR